MISQSQNRVQAIKSKFENLSTETAPLISKKKNLHGNLWQQNEFNIASDRCTGKSDKENKNEYNEYADQFSVAVMSGDDCPEPNSSYLYNKSEAKRTVNETRKSLSRQSSDPGKKLHRSHAFRCDRNQKLNSPQRHGSCKGRSETSDFTIKMGEPKLSKDKLQQLGNFLENKMRKENFVPTYSNTEVPNVVGLICEMPQNSIPDSEVPKNILDQYAKVIKKNRDEKQDAMTDSGVSSETENVDDDKSGRIKRLISQIEGDKPVEVSDDCDVKSKIETNLDSMDDLCASSETMKLERKNPHLTLTDTLKKALKQPLPPGPPPKKPPRVFVQIPEVEEKQKKDTKKMLEKLELVLQKREGQVQPKKLYDIAENDLSLKKPKEIHYLCTEILDITQRNLTPEHSATDPITNCLKSLNCAGTHNSISSLPYTRLSACQDSNRNSLNLCCSCSNDGLDRKSGLSTFFDQNKCSKCHVNSDKLNDLDEEPIYDEPCNDVQVVFNQKNQYGTLNSFKVNEKHSRSLEDISCHNNENKVYADTPSDAARSKTPELTMSQTSDFAKLRQNFETGFQNSDSSNPAEKPLKSILVNNSEEYRYAKRNVERKFTTDTKPYRNRLYAQSNTGVGLPKNPQLDTDKENLNRLMTEIYATVTAACNMDENKPGSFPTDDDGNSSEESANLTRSLTEKRKNYVRRVSSRVAYLDPKSIKTTRHRHQTSVCSYKSDITDNPYSTFRSWKSFRTSQNNLNMKRESLDSKVNLTDSSGNILSMDCSDGSMDNMSIDEKTGCVDIDLREGGLFNMCLLVGINHMTGEAYVKSVFPNQVAAPAHIESLVYPETLGGAPELAEPRRSHTYSLVLTDERGERAYGYCRRVLPEGATTCLPLCYCLIGRYRAPGFYYKVLQEIESRHGCSDVEMNALLQQLYESDFPNPGEEITLSKPQRLDHTAPDKSQTMPDVRTLQKMHVEDECVNLENNNNCSKFFVGLEYPIITTIKRPIEPRVDEDCLSVLLDTLGAGLLIKVFGSLLLERKLIIVGDDLRLMSMCMEGVQQCVYPFVWQQPLIAAVPPEIRSDVLHAPLPLLAGMLRAHDFEPAPLEEGMLIDLTHPSKVLSYQGDESTILPTSSYKFLKTSLQMESIKNKDRQDDRKMRNVMISEAFVRFFVDILGDFWQHFSVGVMKDGDMGKGDVVFDKEAFVRSAKSKPKQNFLEWFTETAMFNHFIGNMAASWARGATSPAVKSPLTSPHVDAPLPHFYQLFEERARSCPPAPRAPDSTYRGAINRKVRLLKTKLRDLVT